MSEIICPKCDGKKKRWNACFPVALSGWQPCGTCGAIGAISEEKKAIIEIGAEIRRTRDEKNLDVKFCAESFGCNRYLWSKIENGESTLSDAYKARSVVENIRVEFADYFDVIVHSGADKSETIDTKRDRKFAEERAEEARQFMRKRNMGGLVEVKERRVREIIG